MIGASRIGSTELTKAIVAREVRRPTGLTGRRVIQVTYGLTETAFDSKLIDGGG